MVFGSDSGFSPTLDLSKLDGSNGFTLTDSSRGYASGSSVSGAGDVNGDGFDDLIIGKPDRRSPQSYIVFGSGGGFDPTLELSTLNSSDGFTIRGEFASRTGYSVSAAGDFDGDGFDDLIIGAPGAKPVLVFNYIGQSYVVFGSDSGRESDIFVLNGIAADDFFGSSVSGAGDINDDGIDDVVITASGARQSYVVFGSNSGFDPSLEVSALDGSNGFALNGSSFSVSGAGDINDDGIDDLIAGGADQSYVVFGSNSGFSASLDLSALDGTNGFVLTGASGSSVSGAGDINDDGIDDLIIGATSAGSTGQTYVVFGKSRSNIINGTNGKDNLVGTPNNDRINGFAGDDRIIGKAGDDFLNGGDGNDTVSGGIGNDTINGGEGDDLLRGDLNNSRPQGKSGGDDLIFGGSGNDRIGGKGGNDQLYGEAGDDLIWGDDGDDLLRGGLGNDVLTGDDFSGGQGSDTFVLAIGEGTDTIVDYETGIDFIGLVDGLSFGQLSISQSGADALINLSDETLAVVQNVSASTLTETAFVELS